MARVAESGQLGSSCLYPQLGEARGPVKRVHLGATALARTLLPLQISVTAAVNSHSLSATADYGNVILTDHDPAPKTELVLRQLCPRLG